MKIRNSTDYPDYLLRRMAVWCCQQIGMPSHKLRLAVFRNSRSWWGGCARPWKNQVTVCVGPASCFPANCSTHEPGEKFHDRTECLVAVTAHEVFHVAAHCVDEHKQRTRGYGKGRGSSERVTCAEEMRVLRLFREQREGLMQQWKIAPTSETRPALSIRDTRARKAINDLARWERKLK